MIHIYIEMITFPCKIDKYSKYLFSKLNIEKLKKNKIENYKYWQSLYTKILI